MLWFILLSAGAIVLMETYRRMRPVEQLVPIRVKDHDRVIRERRQNYY